MKRKLLALILISSFITPSLFIPWRIGLVSAAAPVPAIANVQVGNIQKLIEEIEKDFVYQLASQLANRIVDSTIKWAQGGFEGNPSFATNPSQYFGDIADGVAGDFIRGSNLDFLCSPMQADIIRASLTLNYYEPQPFQCTLTQVGDNLGNLITGFNANFKEQGFDYWFSMTQNPTNNVYGSYLKAQATLNSQIAEALNIQETQLNWSDGFLSWSDCEAKNPEPWIEMPSTDGSLAGRRRNPGHDEAKWVGECIQYGPVKTPGSIIQGQLQKSLGSGIDRIITAEKWNQLLSAVAVGLVNKYVFSDRGLFGKDSRRNTGSGSAGNNTASDRLARVDLDRDRIPDGQDIDGDGLLNSSSDQCFHGGRAPDCRLSAGTTSSPYFKEFCEDLNRAESSVTEYSIFINSNRNQIKSNKVDFFQKEDSKLWAKRASEAQEAIATLSSTVQGLRIEALFNVEVATNRYGDYLDKINESLVKDGDLDLAGAGSIGGGGIFNLISRTSSNLSYLREVKRTVGKCEAPNISGVESIGLPINDDDAGGSCPVPTTPVSLCQGVVRERVLEILTKYPPTNEGIMNAIPEVKALYGEHVAVVPHPDRLDKIDFGGGLVVDVIQNAGIDIATWQWLQDCDCGGGGRLSGGGTGGGGTPGSGTTPVTNTAPNQLNFVRQFSQNNAEWASCTAGNGVSCHRFVREAAKALSEQNSKWGLLTKGPGEQQCTMEACGRNLSGGFAEDAIAYLIGSDPAGPLGVVDIIQGAGAPGASIQWNEVPRRAGNNWAPVP